MEDIKSFSLNRKSDKETFKRFDVIRGALSMKRSEAIIQAMKEFVDNHPLDKINPLDGYVEGIKPELPVIAINMSVREIQARIRPLKVDEVLKLKDQSRLTFNTIDIEAESRIDR